MLHQDLRKLGPSEYCGVSFALHLALLDGNVALCMYTSYIYIYECKAIHCPLGLKKSGVQMRIGTIWNFQKKAGLSPNQARCQQPRQKEK